MLRISPSVVVRLFLALVLLLGTAQAAEVMPPKPPRHFTDYAGVVSEATRNRLDGQLAQFERESSSQIVVVVYKKMQSDSSIADYTQRVAQSWYAGIAEKNNGAVLFVFIEDRSMYLQVGYGLEGAIPDALAGRIIAGEITPRFRDGNFDAGLAAGVQAIIQAARGEYKGTGKTFAESQGNVRRKNQSSGLMVIFFFIFLFFLFSAMRSGGTSYGSRGRRRGYGWGGGFGGFGAGGGGGGGGFSGGGGSFGGGGAGGRW